MKTITKTLLSALFFSFALGACQQDAPIELCTDGLDNDGNDLVDCADKTACGEEPSCQEGSNCEDGLDNDLDGLIDCESPACQGSEKPCFDKELAVCSTAPFLQPADGQALGNNGAGGELFAGSCTGGNGASELVFQTGSATATTVTVTLTPDPNDASDLGLYLRDSCTDADSEVGCSDEAGVGGPEILRNIPIRAGNSISIFVDGVTADQIGAFTLTISEP